MNDEITIQKDSDGLLYIPFEDISDCSYECYPEDCKEYYPNTHYDDLTDEEFGNVSFLYGFLNLLRYYNDEYIRKYNGELSDVFDNVIDEVWKGGKYFPLNDVNVIPMMTIQEEYISPNKREYTLVINPPDTLKDKVLFPKETVSFLKDNGFVEDEDILYKNVDNQQFVFYTNPILQEDNFLEIGYWRMKEDNNHTDYDDNRGWMLFDSHYYQGDMIDFLTDSISEEFIQSHHQFDNHRFDSVI